MLVCDWLTTPLAITHTPAAQYLAPKGGSFLEELAALTQQGVIRHWAKPDGTACPVGDVKADAAGMLQFDTFKPYDGAFEAWAVGGPHALLCKVHSIVRLSGHLDNIEHLICPNARPWLFQPNCCATGSRAHVETRWPKLWPCQHTSCKAANQYVLCLHACAAKKKLWVGVPKMSCIGRHVAASLGDKLTVSEGCRQYICSMYTIYTGMHHAPP